MTSTNAAVETARPPALDITDLSVGFVHRSGRVRAVEELSLTIGPGEALALVGESGSGKSATAFAVMGLLPRAAEVRGSVRLAGAELLGRSDREMSRIRGRRISLVHQDPLAALTPVRSVGAQLAEAVIVHAPALGRRAARQRAVDLLDSVGIAAARTRAAALPHEVSGGMRQRVGIAMAIANDPEVIIADEPTSALDITVAAQILDLLDDMRARTGAALLLITHDLGVVAQSCDRVAVLHRGMLTEQGTVTKLFAQPASAPLRALLTATAPPDGPAFGACVGSTTTGAEAADGRTGARYASSGPAAEDRARATVLQVNGLHKHHRLRRGAAVHAVDDVDLHLSEGQTLALIGESGCGKSTVLREITRLRAPESGSIEMFGRDLSVLGRRDRATLRRQVQMVVQDPSSALNPTMTVADLIAEPLRIHGARVSESRARARELLPLVGLSPEHAERMPAQLSGGQRQRVAIARALAPQPRLLLLDEPVSALDASLRTEIMDLLTELRARFDLAFLMVSHDIALTRRTVEHVAVMYLGQVVEAGPARDVLDRPTHPYTQALVAATPVLDARVARARKPPLTGEVPDPLARRAGCGFLGRCPLAAALPAAERAVCARVRPPMRRIGTRETACHHANSA